MRLFIFIMTLGLMQSSIGATIAAVNKNGTYIPGVGTRCVGEITQIGDKDSQDVKKQDLIISNSHQHQCKDGTINLTQVSIMNQSISSITIRASRLGQSKTSDSKVYTTSQW